MTVPPALAEYIEQLERRVYSLERERAQYREQVHRLTTQLHDAMEAAKTPEQKAADQERETLGNQLWANVMKDTR